jgi:hypothetical protein
MNMMGSLRRRWIWGVALAAGVLVARQESSAAQKWKLGLGDKTVTYRTYKDPAGRFELEYPAKDWRQLPSAGSSLALFSRNDGAATVAVDYLRMTATLSPSQIGTMAEVEIQDLKERHPQAKDFTSELMESKGGRGAIVRYVSTGSKGPERVMQYSIPVGQDLYRVIAIVAESSLAKYEGVVMHVLASIAPLNSAAASKD